MKQIFSMLLGAWAEHQKLSSLKLKHRMCWMAAEQICAIGFREGPVVQKYLNTAKDSLYAAAALYKKRIERLTDY